MRSLRRGQPTVLVLPTSFRAPTSTRGVLSPTRPVRVCRCRRRRMSPLRSMGPASAGMRAVGEARRRRLGQPPRPRALPNTLYNTADPVSLTGPGRQHQWAGRCASGLVHSWGLAPTTSCVRILQHAPTDVVLQGAVPLFFVFPSCLEWMAWGHFAMAAAHLGRAEQAPSSILASRLGMVTWASPVRPGAPIRPRAPSNSLR